MVPVRSITVRRNLAVEGGGFMVSAYSITVRRNLAVQGGDGKALKASRVFCDLPDIMQRCADDRYTALYKCT